MIPTGPVGTDPADPADSTDYGMLMAGTFISVLPVMALFLLLQKEFISGLTAGSVKG